MSGCLLSLGGEFYILRTRREEVEMNLDAEKRDGYYSVTFTATGNEYAVWENGTVQDMDEYQKTPYLKLDPSELNALETESSQVIKAITNVDNPNISWETKQKT